MKNKKYITLLSLILIPFLFYGCAKSEEDEEDVVLSLCAYDTAADIDCASIAADQYVCLENPNLEIGGRAVPKVTILNYNRVSVGILLSLEYGQMAVDQITFLKCKDYCANPKELQTTYKENLADTADALGLSLYDYVTNKLARPIADAGVGIGYPGETLRITQGACP